MGDRIPSWPYKKVLKNLEKLGYLKVRRKGSHIRMKCSGKDPITVPAANPVARGTLRKILRDIDIDLSEFLNL